VLPRVNQAHTEGTSHCNERRDEEGPINLPDIVAQAQKVDEARKQADQLAPEKRLFFV
jgi:hypothetical protein